MNVKKILKEKFNQLVDRAKKIKKRSFYVIGAGIIFAILSFFLNRDSIYVRPYEIERGSYGTQKTPYKITLEAENLSKNMEFSVSVSGRKYEEEEAKEKFSEKIEKLKVEILGENEDFEHINSSLKYINDLGDGIRASYSFSPMQVKEYYEKYENIKLKEKSASESEIENFKYFVNYQNVIDGSGKVFNDDFKVDEFCTGYIEIMLCTEVKGKEGPYRSEKFMIPIRIIAKDLTPIESFKVAFKKMFLEKDMETIDNDTIELPKVVNNFKIIYKEKRNLSFLIMPVLGILAAILLEARDKEKEKEIKQRRLRLLEIDYTQIITKILLYVSSGMTIRNSMIRLADGYQNNIANNEQLEKRAAYEELVVVKNKLSSGYSEVKAYEEMAKNINLRTYTRFLNIIIQSIKNGNKDLKNILNMEVQDALYERKQNAKKLGEEAATKLVLPLMMMLAIIMVVIMVPAFMGM